ncbi:hypothetical protein [Streptomyces adelaidensis]|uniref:hypothetical protein n=1 Tax=Streptomyces adelaidensis TaxID=2796465 RepID=UPI0019083CCF|nr:hypothetical protein [Streptomyces adelaidensis]
MTTQGMRVTHPRRRRSGAPTDARAPGAALRRSYGAGSASRSRKSSGRIGEASGTFPDLAGQAWSPQ